MVSTTSVIVVLVVTIFVTVFMAGERLVLMEVKVLTVVSVWVVVATVVDEYVVEVPNTIMVSVE